MDKRFLENSLLIVIMVSISLQIWYNYVDRRKNKLKF